MKTISAALAAHFGQEATTLATLWRVVRTDGTVFAFTDHDQDLVYPAGSPTGDTYRAAGGYRRTAIETTAALNVDNLDIDGVLDDDGITEADLRAGRWDYAAVQISVVNWADLTMGAMRLRTGRLGEVNAGRFEFRAELRGMMQQLQQSVGRLYGVLCDADFGDARCGIVLTGSPTSPWVKTGSVTRVTSNRVFADSARVEAEGFFDYGKITFTSGENAGLSMEVKTFAYVGSPAEGQIALQLPMPYTVAIGDAYTMQAGCKKRFAEDCRDTYDNAVNHRGFPHVPGSDQVVSGGL